MRLRRWIRAIPGVRTAVVAVLVPLVTGCSLLTGPSPLRQNAPQIMTVSSPLFGQGSIPVRYTCHAPGHPGNPPIYWSGAPEGTKSLALVVDDADAPITPYIYWVVFDIRPTTTDIQAGSPLPPGARQGDNSRGFAGYDAPCPIHGSHTYRFTVYALSTQLHLGNGASVKAVWTAIARNAIARGRLTATARD
jgi:hypothetical protein